MSPLENASKLCWKSSSLGCAMGGLLALALLNVGLGQMRTQCVVWGTLRQNPSGTNVCGQPWSLQIRSHVSNVESAFARIRAALDTPSHYCGGSYGLWVAFRWPCAESLDDSETHDEEADANEDLEAALLGLEGNLAGGGKNEHEGETCTSRTGTDIS
jgi:hypothetical protein